MKCDIAVIGGGPAGIGAAVAAGSMGQDVVLVERHPVLGGMGTAGLVTVFCAAHHDGERFIIGGVFEQVRQALIARKAMYPIRDRRRGEFFAPEGLDQVAQELCREAGVRLLLGRSFQSVSSSPGESRVVLDDGSTLDARFVVDATGDAAVAHAAGVETTFGRGPDHAVMPLTYCFTVGPVDKEAIRHLKPEGLFRCETLGEEYLSFGGQPWWVEPIQAARARGDLNINRDPDTGHWCGFSIPGRPEYMCFNVTRVFVDDPTDPEEMAQASAEGKRQVEECVRFFRQSLPGFQDAELDELALQIGVRESRQIVGLYCLNLEDLIELRQFDDVVAQCCYTIDIHIADRIDARRFPPGTHYDIPWRCLVPATGPENLVVGGRCISATSEAMSSFRVMPSCMALGEAAGVTAALGVSRGCAARDVDPAAVQDRLRETGGILT